MGGMVRNGRVGVQTYLVDTHILAKHILGIQDGDVKRPNHTGRHRVL